MPRAPRTSAARIASTLALAASVTALGACGGDDDDGGGGGEPSQASELCGSYREAVTNVRASADPAEQGEDFAAAAEAARAAAEGTSEDDLTTGGADYVAAMETLAGAYEDAAAAGAAGDENGISVALDTAEPTDDAANALAEDGGLEGCVLPGPEQGEQGVSQSGYPAMIVPESAYPGSPPGESTVSYPLSDSELLRLVRGPELDTGTVPADEAAGQFEDQFGEAFTSFEQVGDSGNDLLEMREYTYEITEQGQNAAGTVHVFSGQGNVFALDCQSDTPDASAELDAACDRAVESLGFLMF